MAQKQEPLAVWGLTPTDGIDPCCTQHRQHGYLGSPEDQRRERERGGVDEWSLHACNASKGKTGFSCTGETLGANTLKGAWWQAWRPWSAAGWRLQCWQCRCPGLLALEKGWSQVLGEIGFKLMSGFFFLLLLLILELHSSLKKHYGHIFPAVTGTKWLQQKIFLIGRSLNPGNESLFQNTTCCEPWATSRRTGPVHQYLWISLSLLPLSRNLHKFLSQKYCSDVSFPPPDSSETHKRAFYSAAWIEIPYPPPPHTHSHSCIYTLQIFFTGMSCVRARTNLSTAGS